MKVIGAIRGTPEHIPIPIANSGSLWNPANVISGAATTANVGIMGYNWWHGSEDGRLDKYKKENGKAIADIKEGVDELRREKEKVRSDLNKKINFIEAKRIVQNIISLYLDEYGRIFPQI